VYEVEITSKLSQCSIISKFTVSEENAPEITIRSSTGKPVCPGTQVTLTARGAPNFLWQEPAGSTNAEIIVSPLKTTTYIVKGYSTTGQDTCKSFQQATVEVYPVQKPELGSPRTGCVGDTITLDGGEGNQAWRWSIGEETRFVGIANSINPLILEITDNNGCIWSDTTSVTIKPLPTVDLGRDRIVCQGTEVILDAGPADEYIWNNGDSTRYVNVLESGIYAVTISILGCTGSDDVFIRVNSRDSLRIDSLNIMDITCNGANDGSMRIFVNGEGSYYEYSIDGGTTFRDNQGYFDNLAPGSDFEIVITEDSVCTLRYEGTVEIHEPDVISLDSSQKPPTCSDCSDGEIRLSVSGGTPPYLIRWVTLDTTATLKNIGLGSYPVSVTDANGCYTEMMIELLKGEEETPPFIPNAFTPNGDGINEKWEISFLKDKPECVVQVFNRGGRKIFESERGYPEPWDGRGPDGDIMPVGSYFYLFRLNDATKPMTGTVTIIR
jgi:gliding motility-associated-like protein